MQYKSLIRNSLLSYLDDHLKRGSETVFVYRRGLRQVRWSYEQLVLTARQTASELHSRGIRTGDRVLLCGRNSPEWVAAFWACLLVGAVVVPLDKESSFEFAGAVKQQTDPKIVFADQDVLSFSKLDLPIITLDQLIETVSSQSSGRFHKSNPDDSTLAEIIFTSGTTSTPKGVMLTHGNLIANLLPLEHEIGKYLKWERLVHPVRFLNLVPLSHVFGQFMGLLVPQLLGGEVHFHDSLSPADIVDRTRKNRISVIVLVPRILESLRHWVERRYAARGESDKLKNKIHGNALRRWWQFRAVHRDFGLKFWAFLCGGATLEEQTENLWRALGFAVLQGYGMTETASLVSVTHPFKQSYRSIGELMPGYELKLDQSGEILVRGPSVSSGYWTAEGQLSRTADDWLRTGDVGVVDDAGHLHYKGRVKEVIVTAAGLNIFPEDLEEALNRQPEVRSSCVITSEGPNGDQPLAVLILKESGANVDAIVERANNSLAKYQRIRRGYVWREPNFPVTSTHKILKREVAARIGHPQTIISDDEVQSENPIVSEAQRITGERHSAADDGSLKLTTDLKLDSLGRIELLSALEDRYQIDIDEAAFTEATTVGEVERIVRGEIDSATTPYPYPTWSHRFPVTWIRILLFYLIILPITRVMSRMRVEGMAHLDDLTGPTLFVANHVTLGDHALVLAGLPLRLRHKLAIAMEGERLRNWLHPPMPISLFRRLKQLAEYVLVTTFFQVFPLPRKSGFRRSFAYAAECIERGKSVLVFPEGVRAPRGQIHMSEFKIGIGLLTSQLAVPVVPVKLNGLYELKRRQQYFASKGMVSVVFGEPIQFEHSMSASEIASELQRRLEEM
ncbi:MAG: AMP-binding protein [Blastocatellia bacterium]|nr:MAG: AMP-binding protein [Blastocatellia bacterium]